MSTVSPELHRLLESGVQLLGFELVDAEVAGGRHAVLRVYIDSPNGVSVDDCAAIALTMKSGALATSSITLGAAQDMSRLRFCFQNLTAESGRSPYHPGAEGWTFQAREPVEQAEVDAIVNGCGKPVERFAGLFAEFAKRLLGEPNDAVTLGEARQSLELVTAIYDSAGSGRTVRLPVPDNHRLYRGWIPDQ